MRGVAGCRLGNRGVSNAWSLARCQVTECPPATGGPGLNQHLCLSFHFKITGRCMSGALEAAVALVGEVGGGP